MVQTNSPFVQGEGLMEMPFKDGLLCTANPTERLGYTLLDAAGSGSSAAFSIVTEGNVSVGDTRYYQFWFRDGGGLSVCGLNSNLTSGLRINWQ